MDLYEVTVEYVKYLRKFEPTKILSNADGKEQRKFLGVIVQKNGYKYVIPLSSPKYKKDYKIRDYQGENLPEDFSFVAYADRIILLKDTNVPVVYMYEKKESGEIDFFGKIQCNNMIPAPESELTKINIEGITDIAYKNLKRMVLVEDAFMLLSQCKMMMEDVFILDGRMIVQSRVTKVNGIGVEHFVFHMKWCHPKMES